MKTVNVMTKKVNKKIRGTVNSFPQDISAAKFPAQKDYREAKPLNGGASIRIYAIWVNLGWEWFATKKPTRKMIICEGLVQSPIVPDGEWGSWYIREVEGFTCAKNVQELTSCLPPKGYEWTDLKG